ncbi:cobalt transporter [Palaeococcus ferrophilus]|uniref:cobalt transporter n=1 Tax=Palaeococcus ferrophilus TaxID=83868 RepID=UPI00064F05D5|nr:cobalt transporter [Palaeococcus ferrophilus]
MRAVLKGIFIILVLLAITIPLASSNPDGLEATMEHLGLTESSLYHAPLDYGESWGQSLLMGAVGIGIVFGVVYVLARIGKGV